MSEFWIVTGKRTASTEGLVQKGRELAAERGLEACVLEYPEAVSPNEERICEDLIRKYRISSPVAIIFEYTTFFGDVAPAFAVRIGRGITADCTELRWSEEYGLLQIRPTYGGRKIAVNRSLALPYIATVRRGVFGIADGIISSEEVTLDTARVILSGGLGLGSRENYEKLRLLADMCGAQAGASRAAVAEGFAPYSRQVGQTGTTVRPKLYVAFGISGAVQHLSGITAAEKIIAVNSDPKAPIHNYADYSIIADANEVIHMLLGKKYNAEKSGRSPV